MSDSQSYYGKNLISIEHRLNMCNLAVKYISEKYQTNSITVSDFHLKYPNYNTVSMIQKLKNESDIYYLTIGIDNAILINTWTKWEEIIATIPFIIVPRKNYEIKSEQWYHNNPHIIMKDIIESSNSSTQIRKHIKENKDLKQFLLKSIFEYIMVNKLYQS